MRCKYILLITVFLLSANPDMLVSETSESVTIKKEKSILFNLINGISVSYQKQLRESEAFRLSLHINGQKSYSTEHYNTDTEYEDGKEHEDGDQERKRNSFSYSLSAQYFLMREFDSGITLFGGTGPYFGIGMNKIINDYTYEGDESIREDNHISRGRRVTIGLLSSFGGAVKITESFRIYSEYEISIKKWWQSGSSEYLYKHESENSEPWFNSSVSDSNENGWDFLISDVRLGIAYYF